MAGKYENLVFYSVNTYLSFFINERFYDRHFVWCSPTYNCDKLEDLHPFKITPPSSNPFDIYARISQDIVKEDLHSDGINRNKSGLRRGALIMYEQGVIDESELAQINHIIDKATIKHFRPLLYVIPSSVVLSKVFEVKVELRANPLSVEFQIMNLYRNEFDILEY